MANLSWTLSTFETLQNTIKALLEKRSMKNNASHYNYASQIIPNAGGVADYAPDSFSNQSTDAVPIEYVEDTIKKLEKINTKYNDVTIKSDYSQYDYVPDLNTYIEIVNDWYNKDYNASDHGCDGYCTGLCSLSCLHECNGCRGGSTNNSMSSTGGGCTSCGKTANMDSSITGGTDYTHGFGCSSCDGECNGECGSYCYGNCSSCSGTCYTTCSGICSGSCTGACSGGCDTHCYNSCSSGCDGSASKL